ncbi:Imm49 family immunity protein [Streptomyces sp. NPDC056304]|uniref:Imm49 family immunity protein n=1 Tax=Streptomyces sp. NPDC056304 TaxID=3345778 RepID=UPI0035DDED15
MRGSFGVPGEESGACEVDSVQDGGPLVSDGGTLADEWRQQTGGLTEQGAPPSSTSVEGVVAIAPLAVACLAKANGIPIEVESGYLPDALLDFAWRGKFDA